MQVYDIGFSAIWLVNMGLGRESGRASHDAHLSDDKAVAKMGHPVSWWSERWVRGLVGLFDDYAALYYGVYVFEDFDVLEGVGGEGDEVGVVAGG